MARTLLTVYAVNSDGSGGDVSSNYTAAIADGFYIPNDGKTTYVVVKNGDASAHNVEFQIGATIDGETAGPKAVSVPAGGEIHFGGFNAREYNKGTNQNELWIDFPVTTSMTICAFKIG